MFLLLWLLFLFKSKMTVYNWEDVIIYIIYYIEPDFVYKGF